MLFLSPTIQLSISPTRLDPRLQVPDLCLLLRRRRHPFKLCRFLQLPVRVSSESPKHSMSRSRCFLCRHCSIYAMIQATPCIHICTHMCIHNLVVWIEFDPCRTLHRVPILGKQNAADISISNNPTFQYPMPHGQCLNSSVSPCC